MGNDWPVQLDMQSMMTQWAQEVRALAGSGFQVEEPIPYVFKLTGVSAKHSLGVGIQALNHGNEIGGLFVLREIVRLLQCGLLHLPGTLILGLGNIEAAKQGVRFVEEDLNRCYGKEGKSYEAQRAGELVSIYREADYFLDLHQTQTPSPIPFYPITFTKPALAAIQELDPVARIVPYPPVLLDGSGSSLSRYLHFQDCVAVTVELGTMGYDAYQIAYGTHIALALLGHCRGQGTTRPFAGRIYKIKSTVPAPGPDTWLREDLCNFSRINEGEVIGRTQGSEWCAGASGFIVFPKAVAGFSRTQANPGEPIYVLAEETTLDGILSDPTFGLP